MSTEFWTDSLEGIDCIGVVGAYNKVTLKHLKPVAFKD
jgi:hypothetical protein